MLNHHYIAANIFQTEKDLNGIHPIDLKFKLIDPGSESLKGPGIYFLYFKTELVYIGYYFKGSGLDDVRTQRWIKELATISMRGKRVVFSKNAANAHTNCLQYPKYVGEISDNGFETSAKRVVFADKHWKEFQSNDFLDHFNFYWFPEEKGMGRTKKELKDITKILRKFYKPLCNG
jgi:hypothetical protein